MITLASFLDASPTVEEVDRRIESLEDELHKLRHYRNQHSTVSRLPTEILASIFKVVALSQGLSRGSLKKTNLRHGRLVITHVCKRWRDIAITNPQIWCIVYTSMRRELAQLYVERSRSLSLYIATDLNTSRHSEDTIKYLLTHSTRVWRLEIWNCPPEAVEGLTQLKAPMLKQVSLTVDDDRHQASKMTFLSADPDVPPLRYLSLRNVLFDLDSPFLSQLRTLKLYYTYLVLPEEYHQKLLPFLSRLQRLRHLELDGAIVPSPNHLEDTVVEMPSLFTLQLRPANLTPTLWVLDHLSLPSLRFFNLTINVVTNSEILLPLRATLDKMIPHIESPHVRVDITHNFPSKFESYMSVWSHVDKAEDATPTFRISISKHFDYSVSGALFALLPDDIPTTLSLSSDRRHIFRRGDDSEIDLRNFLLSLPPNVEELHTRKHQHLVTFLSDTPRLGALSDINDPPVFSLPFLKRITLEEGQEAIKVFRPSDEYTRFEEILKARKDLSAEIEKLTIKTTPHCFCSMDEEPLLGLVKALNVVHYESHG